MSQILSNVAPPLTVPFDANVTLGALYIGEHYCHLRCAITDIFPFPKGALIAVLFVVFHSG